MKFIDKYFRESKEIIDKLDKKQIRKIIDYLVNMELQISTLR